MTKCAGRAWVHFMFIAPQHSGIRQSWHVRNTDFTFVRVIYVYTVHARVQAFESLTGVDDENSRKGIRRAQASARKLHNVMKGPILRQLMYRLSISANVETTDVWASPMLIFTLGHVERIHVSAFVRITATAINSRRRRLFTMPPSSTIFVFVHGPYVQYEYWKE